MFFEPTCANAQWAHMHYFLSVVTRPKVLANYGDGLDDIQVTCEDQGHGSKVKVTM